MVALPQETPVQPEQTIAPAESEPGNPSTSTNPENNQGAQSQDGQGDPTGQGGGPGDTFPTASANTPGAASSTVTPPTGIIPGVDTASIPASGTSEGPLNTPSSETASISPTPSGEISAPRSDGVQAPVIAGVSIGCFLIGLIAGLVGAWFLVKRSRRHGRSAPSDQARHDHPSNTVVNVVDHKGYATTQDSNGSGIQLSHFILDATPDRDIATEMGSLGQLLQHHVESHYHAQTVNVSSQALTQAAVNLGLGQGSLGIDMIAPLALDPRTRQVALQHVLSFALFSSIDFSARSRLSMLPAPIAAFLQSVPAPERGQVNLEAVALGLNKWRTLSAFLLHPRRSDRTALPPSDSVLLPQAEALASALNTFLGAFVPEDAACRSEQKSHLEAVIVEVTKLGYVLLSDPCDYIFTHHSGQKPGVRLAVICAGLEKVTAKDGTMLEQSQQVLAPVVVQV